MTYTPIKVSRITRDALIKAIEERCLPQRIGNTKRYKPPKYKMASEIKCEVLQQGMYFENFNGCKKVKRPLVSHYEKWSVLLQRIR